MLRNTFVSFCRATAAGELMKAGFVFLLILSCGCASKRDRKVSVDATEHR
jgi:hypothetical protein